MSSVKLKSAVLVVAVVALTSTLGVSLTRTSPMRSESPLVLGAIGGVVGLVATLIFLSVRVRVTQSLPPERSMRGLKVLLAGFLVAVLGWLVSAFMSLEVGVRVVAFGMCIGAVGMALHIYLWANSDA